VYCICTDILNLIQSSFLCKIKLAPGFSAFVGLMQCGQLSTEERVVAVGGTWHEHGVVGEIGRTKPSRKSEVKAKILRLVSGGFCDVGP
jgi:NADPH-dependent curcumin reductase CurA